MFLRQHDKHALGSRGLPSRPPKKLQFFVMTDYYKLRPWYSFRQKSQPHQKLTTAIVQEPSSGIRAVLMWGTRVFERGPSGSVCGQEWKKKSRQVLYLKHEEELKLVGFGGMRARFGEKDCRPELASVKMRVVSWFPLLA